MNADKLTVFINDEEIEIPTKFVVCHRCEGCGKHVNPAIDGNGLTQEDFDEAGPDFLDDYMNGVYDVPCHNCKGLRVVAAPDLDALSSALKAAWFEQEKEMAELRQMEAMERLVGA